MNDEVCFLFSKQIRKGHYSHTMRVLHATREETMTLYLQLNHLQDNEYLVLFS